MNLTGISIHAPAWGATAGIDELMFVDEISIHAPAWGATFIGSIRMADVAISIHAPAWGATPRHIRNRLLYIFQSTRPRGARQA